MKRQHILAFDKKAFGIDELEGFITMPAKTFFESAAASLFIGRREELERDERFGQFLPYVVQWRKTEQGPEVFTYQRMEGSGESRLARNLSVGGGGHVDLNDIVCDESIIDVMNTTARALAREFNEEFVYRHADNPDEVLSFDQLRERVPGLFPRFVGMINDKSNAVGRVHYGAVFSLQVPDGWEVVCKEAAMSTIGFVPVALAQSRGEGAMENWSQIALANFDLIEKL